LIEMYLAGVSVRRVEDISEALWGTKVRASLVSDLNQKIEAWRKAPLSGEYAYVYVDGMWLKRSWGGEVKNVSVLIAIGVNTEGYREVLAVAEGSKEDKASWEQFLRGLKERGLAGVKLFVSDKSLGFLETLADFYPEAKWQRCVGHWYRNVWTAVPSGKVKEVAAMLKAIRAQEDLAAARVKAAGVVGKRREMKLKAAVECVEQRSGGNAELHELPAGALAQPADEQPAGASHPRDSTQDASGGLIPRRAERVDAGSGAAAAHRRDEMGHETLHGHEPIAGHSGNHARGRSLTTDFAAGPSGRWQRQSKKPKPKSNQPTPNLPPAIY
jgi:hypothetical protein